MGVQQWQPWQRWLLKTIITALKVGAAATIADITVNASTKTLADVQVAHTASVAALTMLISILYSLTTLSIKGVTDDTSNTWQSEDEPDSLSPQIPHKSSPEPAAAPINSPAPTTTEETNTEEGGTT